MNGPEECVACQGCTWHTIKSMRGPPGLLANGTHSPMAAESLMDRLAARCIPNGGHGTRAPAATARPLISVCRLVRGGSRELVARHPSKAQQCRAAHRREQLVCGPPCQRCRHTPQAFAAGTRGVARPCQPPCRRRECLSSRTRGAGVSFVQDVSFTFLPGPWMRPEYGSARAVCRCLSDM